MGRLRWLFLAAALVSREAVAASAADLVLRGGRVWVGKGLPAATAIAVKDGRVAAVGSDADVQPRIGSGTRVVDLHGRLVVPGFNDAHVHFLSGGFGLLSASLRGAKDEQDFARRIAAHARTLPKGTWILDAFEKAAAANPPRERRFRIEHAQVVRKADLVRYRRLGVIASIQPSHCIDDMRWAERRIGKERARDAYNLRSFRAAGIPVAFGTDWFVEPLDPRLGLYAAITRERPEGGPAGGWFPEEKIALEDALDLYTRGSAYAEFAEKEKGTLAPGMLADLAVFAADLFRIPPRQILTTPVDFTVAGGRVVFDRAAGEAGISR